MLTATAMTFETTTTATTNLTSSAAPQTRSRYLAASGSVKAEMRNWRAGGFRKKGEFL